MDAFSKDPSILENIWLPPPWVLMISLKIETNSMVRKRNYIVSIYYPSVKWSRRSCSLMLDVWRRLGLNEHLTPSRWSQEYSTVVSSGWLLGGWDIIPYPRNKTGMGQELNWLVPSVLRGLQLHCFLMLQQSWEGLIPGDWWVVVGSTHLQKVVMGYLGR